MPEDIPSRVLSDVIVHSKYARWWGELGRRETFAEIVARNRQMVLDHLRRDLLRVPLDDERLVEEIDWAYRMVLEKKVLPAMRSLQFGGEPILRDPNRIYNCGFMHASRPEFFRELLFLLLGGSGIGYSVQAHHVARLPPVKWPTNYRRYNVEDTIKGWADALDALIQAYLGGGWYPEFDFRDIRPRGTVLKTSGGKAPGPEPLRKMLRAVENIMVRSTSYHHGRLRPIDVHDIACHVADCVLSGGIRRSAMIALFSPDDEDMLYAKSGNWWVDNSQRGRANNSAVLLRNEDEDLFDQVFDALRGSGSGEPGVFWTNDRDIGTNPCSEIALYDMQFCNLTTINAGNVEDQRDLEERARAAAILGTLQASFTDFHYLDVGWREQTRRERLIGVSMTGIATGRVQELDLDAAARAAVFANTRIAERLGINAAARVTTVKPEGTASLVLGTSSGVHPWYDRYYIRRVRLHKTEAMAQYLMAKLPYREESIPHIPWPLEDDEFDPETVILSVPQKAPEGAATRDEGALALLERVADITRRWILPGHRSGLNANNVSTTVDVREDEWDDVRRWMFDNRCLYNGIAILPYDGGTYTQAPYEAIDADMYEALAAMFETIDVTEIDETDDYTTAAGEAACAGGACEVTFA